MFVIRLFRDDEIIESVKGFAQKYGITAGYVSAIGAAGSITLGFFDKKKKGYKEKKFDGEFEILSLTGNIGMFDGEPIVHAHMIFGDDSYAVKGGHLISAVVSVTCEVMIRSLDTIIHRELEEDTNLKLMRL
jgi:hypothetical protein